MDMHATNPLWQEHIERLRSLYAEPAEVDHAEAGKPLVSDTDAAEARRGEWAATPPGRLGRRLLADIDLWLEFFAIARAD